MTTCEDIKLKRQHMCWTSAEAWGFAQEEICQKCLETFQARQPTPAQELREELKVVRFPRRKHRGFYIGRMIKERKA